jgi:hypothetical protein
VAASRPAQMTTERHKTSRWALFRQAKAVVNRGHGPSWWGGADKLRQPRVNSAVAPSRTMRENGPRSHAFARYGMGSRIGTLMVRRRFCAVSNHEVKWGPHPSRRASRSSGMRGERRAEFIIGPRFARTRWRSPRMRSIKTLMVRRRPCAVSNHEVKIGPHPSRRGEDAAPQDEE